MVIISATGSARLFFVVLLVALTCFVNSSEDPGPENVSSVEVQSVSMGQSKYCAKFSKWPENADKSKDKLGKKCTTKDNRRGRWMYNENGRWDCLQCCEDHTWNGTECVQCEPGYEAPQGVLENNCQEKDNFPDNGNKASANPTDESISSDDDQGNQSPGESPRTGEIEISDCSPGEVKVGNVTSNSADVAWHRFCKDCDGVHGIEIAIHKNTAQTTMFMTSKIVDPSEASFSWINLEPDIIYCLELRASNPSKSGPWSKPVRFQTRSILNREANSPGDSIPQDMPKVVNDNDTDALLDLNVGENIIHFLASNKGKYKLSVTFLGDTGNGADTPGNNRTTECKPDVPAYCGGIVVIGLLVFIVFNNLLWIIGCFRPKCWVSIPRSPLVRNLDSVSS